MGKHKSHPHYRYTLHGKQESTRKLYTIRHHAMRSTTILAVHVEECLFATRFYLWKRIFPLNNYQKQLESYKYSLSLSRQTE